MIYLVVLDWWDGHREVLGAADSDANARILADAHTDVYTETDVWATDHHGHSLRWLNPTRCVTIRPMEVLS